MYRTNMSMGEAAIPVSIHVYCPHEAYDRGLENWSLQALQRQQDTQEHYTLVRCINTVLSKMRVEKAFAPNVAAASASIVGSSELNRRIRLGTTSLYRKKELPADGVFLEEGDAFIMSAAGCPLILATAGDYLITAHAGRDSLLDRTAIAEATPGRKHFSVVNAIIEAFVRKQMRPQQIAMCMQYAIPANMFGHRFDHPRHGAFNRALGTFVNYRWPGCAEEKDGTLFLNLESLFADQAREAGVRHVWHMNSLADFPLLAHTHDGKNPLARNLFVVKREKYDAS